MFNKSISIPVTEDQHDEYGGRTRSRPRRKRRKSELRGRSDVAKRTCKQLMRRWPLLLSLTALLLIILQIRWTEYGNISQSFKLLFIESKYENAKKEVGCLKLLPLEELQHLDLQLNKDSFAPIKKVIYLSDNDTPYDTNSRQESGITRFNLFTGFQTLNQREESFKVNETSSVHCGFYNDSGGFTISNEDKSYMQNCKKCSFYLCIWWWRQSLSAYWDVKCITSEDSKSQFRRDPLGVFEALLWRSKSVLAISEHGACSSVYDEAKAVVKKNKATPEEVEVQMIQYQHDGLPRDKRFNGKKALNEASVIVREHTPVTNLFMCLWFNEVVRFTSRDQLSFPYVLWRLKVCCSSSSLVQYSTLEAEEEDMEAIRGTYAFVFGSSPFHYLHMTHSWEEMAKSSADDKELRRACESAIEDAKQNVVMSIRVAKSKGAWGKGKFGKGAQMAKPRSLLPPPAELVELASTSSKDKGEKTKAFLRVFKYTNGNVLEQAKVYKLKRLGKVEVLTNDRSGCTFMLGFDNLRNQRVAPIHWTMRNLDDRNQLLVCILHICKDAMGHLPKVVGIDIVELALWAKEHTSTVSKQQNFEDGPSGDMYSDGDSTVTVENELVSQAEEEDMEALLGTYVVGIGEAEVLSERLKRELHALEAANVHAVLESEHLVHEVLQGIESATFCVEDLDEWLSLFNVKLRHMREDIQAIEIRNNKLEMQSFNYKALVVELDKLLEKLRIPSEVSDCLAGGSFDESSMCKYMEACEWIRNALRGFDALDPRYAKARAVKEKRAELDIIKLTFVRKACEFLRDYFRGQLKAPDHVDLHNKCRIYARLLHHLKILDQSSLFPLRKTYCNCLNQLLRRETHEFANELRAGTKAPKVQSVWFEGSTAPNQNVNTSMVSEAYSKMLAVFVPLLVDESSFLSFFMRFEASSPDSPSIHDDDDDDDDDLGMMEVDENGTNKGAVDLVALNESLCDLLDGIQDDFYAIVDWAHKIDPLLCVSMHAVTERHLSGLKAETDGYVRLLLDAMEDRISTLFVRFVDEAHHQIEKNDKNVKHTAVMSFIPRFALLATRLEQYIQGQSRDLVDQAYIKIIGVMFVTLDNIAQADPKHSDIFLLENYAAFQNSLYDLANCVPTLAKFYHQASESYEQACMRHMSVIIYYQFERLFQFARKIEDLMLTNSPEEIQFQAGMSKSDLRKVDKHITAMHKKLMKKLSSEELLPVLWDKCKTEFLDKYESFAQLAAKVYPNENIPSVTEIQDILASI
ncbi:hypothetical protein L1987_51593 [Smallanthus sonchifolius]|uniref:Uncharacterized protein n=1 Tax=Smallanthus sonchifolius TaxID=185202 RepID=A0ACB9EQP7_9ASTR|nr:hypothetical protein L1987_51593 [Smallanthus sonchifolius]